MLARNGMESLDPFTSRDVQLFLKCSPIRRLYINVVEKWKKNSIHACIKCCTNSYEKAATRMSSKMFF